MNLLFEPLSLDFMQQALIIALMVSITAGVLSCLLVLKGWSLMGDAVSHAVLPGLVIAWVLNVPMLIGAFFSGLICALSTGYLTENSRLKEDTVMGIVFSALFALGVLLFNRVDTGLHLHQVLFGDMLGVSWQDILLTASLTVPTFLVVILKRRDLLAYVFDPQHARVIGLNTRALHYALLIILSLTIVAAIKTVGIILIISVLIAPGAISYQITRRFEHMLWWSILISAFSTLTGVLLSYHIDSAPAPTIVVILTTMFIVAFLLAPKHGLLRQSRKLAKGHIIPSSTRD